MLKKGTKLYSILTGSCPRCHEESMYQTSNPYALSQIFKMHERCSHCGLKYKIEPSFFYGAMYVSYAVGIAFAVAAFVISFLFIGTSLKTAFISIVATLVAFMPLIIRLSRNIWINFFIKYDSHAVEHHHPVKG
ncbi:MULTISPECIES: DUF983 domain-containing protein [Flagellimonas]|uniref:DUF983 domain-containing protein n=2 Tax=Flagellimonas TaxID=444459 RepID=A0A3A1NGL6_9FLAO|nr:MULTISPECIES: DUF983 domain-containing protein [Allomuricauda]RIV44248.1 DUF983 domain-containing protein [Allomuricauda maritima]RIV70536.1 DUF983 domain-containing protein [Allomuricauda aequoris]TXJ94167.1 DUF983 domain-containing protein [Allomuricauda maritima]TXK01963.1 DUF983 domain-containing protein [Allomuricauda aequoris]